MFVKVVFLFLHGWYVATLGYELSVEEIAERGE